MSSRHNTQTEPSKRLIMNAALAKIGEPEVLLLLDNIERLRAMLYRFAPQLDSESAEVFTLTQATLETIRYEIRRCFAFL